MLTLDRLRNPSDRELGRFDLAAVDLACADGLPGSERLDIPACLAWIDRAAAWVQRQTEATIGRYRERPEAFDHSEGTFRIAALMNVLWRGLGVRYNPVRIKEPDELTDSGDNFLHGIIEGRGGTCASLPVLVVAVGRRLGYPLRLVTTARHQFCRWEEPGGERFNIEINNTGLNTHPDEYYLTWPADIRGMKWQTETKYLRSLTRRDELAHAWSKRGFCLRDHGRLREATDCFATACSLVNDDHLLDRCLWELVREWERNLAARTPVKSPNLTIYFPPERRYSGLPLGLEREIIAFGVLEALLDEPIPQLGQVACYVQN